TGEPKPFGRLPSWPERRVPWEIHHLVRAFRGARTTDDSKVSVSTTGFFGGRPALVWSGMSPEARLTLPFTVRTEGRYALRLTAFRGFGEFDIELDGAPVRPRLEYGTGEEECDLLLGTHTLEAGEHTLGFRAAATGAEAGSLALELLRLLALP